MKPNAAFLTIQANRPENMLFKKKLSKISWLSYWQPGDADVTLSLAKVTNKN